MNTSHLYQSEVTWTGERRGELTAPGLPTVEVGAPPEFKGHEGVWTPEHLFVSAVATCFLTTFLAIAEHSRLELREIRVSAEGRLGKAEGQGYSITEISLRPRLTLERPEDAERAGRLVEKAERNCFISNSITSRVRLEPEVATSGESADLPGVA
jgi:peroxiredoxin-like protein